MIESVVTALIAILSPSTTMHSMPAMSTPRGDIAYGADSTGLKDSTDVLQHMIDFKHGFYLLAGRYRLRKPLILRDNTGIFALEGTASLFPDPANTGPGGGLLLVAKAVHNVAMAGVIFDGQASSAAPLPSSTTRLVYIDGGTNVGFTSEARRNSNGSALVFTGGSTPVVDSGVRQSKFSNLGFGWQPPGIGALKETAPVIVFANGLPVDNYGNFASDNQIADVGGDTVSVQQQRLLLAAHNRLDFAQVGWWPSNMATAVTYGVSGSYVFQTRGTAPNQNVVLRGNIVRGATGNYFDLTSIDQLQVVDNIASNCGGAGVAFGHDVSYFSLAGNTLTHNFPSASYAYPNLSHRGSLSFGRGSQPCMVTIRDGMVEHNNFADGERPSQPIDAWQEAGVTLVNVQSDVSIVQEGAPQPVASTRPVPDAATTPTQLTPEETRARSAWSTLIEARPQPAGGCFKVMYPSLDWQRARCKRAPKKPYSPMNPTARPQAE